MVRCPLYIESLDPFRFYFFLMYDGSVKEEGIIGTRKYIPV